MSSLPRHLLDPRIGTVQEVHSHVSARVSNMPIPTLEMDREEALMIRPFSQYMFELNDPGNTNMAVDGSVTPVEFRIDGDINHTYVLNEIRILLSASNSLDFDSDDRQSFGPAGLLSNGITMQHFVDEVEGTISLIPRPIVNVKELGILCAPDYFNGPVPGNKQDDQIWVYTFSQPVILFWSAPMSLQVFINDDLTDFDTIEMLAVGTQERR